MDSEVIARPRADAAPATTRFVVVGRPLAPASTSLAAPDADEPITTTLLLYLPTGSGPENAEAALKDAGLSGYRTDRDATDLAGGRRCRCVHIPGDLPATAIRQAVTHLRRRGIGIRYLGGYPAVHPAELPVGSQVPIRDADNP
jgi:prephenate dehydratase